TAVRLRALDGGAVITVDGGAGDAAAPALAVDTEGRALVGWREAGGARFALFGGDGERLAAWAPEGGATGVALAAVEGGYQVAWAEPAPAGARPVVRGQRLDGEFEPLGSGTLLGAGVEPTLARVGDGAALAWMRAVDDGYEVCCLRLDGEGAPHGAEQVLARPVPGVHLTGAAVAGTREGGIAVAWTEIESVGGASTVEVRRLEGAAWSEAVALPG